MPRHSKELIVALPPICEDVQSSLLKVPEDERVKGIIDVLVQVYGMSLKMISSYADIEEQEISDFLSGSNQMSYEKKYRLAVKTFSLMQAMRNM